MRKKSWKKRILKRISGIKNDPESFSLDPKTQLSRTGAFVERKIKDGYAAKKHLEGTLETAEGAIMDASHISRADFLAALEALSIASRVHDRYQEHELFNCKFYSSLLFFNKSEGERRYFGEEIQKSRENSQKYAKKFFELNREFCTLSAMALSETGETKKADRSILNANDTFGVLDDTLPSWVLGMLYARVNNEDYKISFTKAN